MMQVVSVTYKKDFPDNKATGILADIRDFLGITGITSLKISKKYYLEGITEKEAGEIADKLLRSEIVHDTMLNGDFFTDADFVREIAYLPGVMNPEIQSIMDSVHSDLKIKKLVAADSSYRYAFYGENLEEKEIDEIVARLLMNKTVETLRKETPKTLLIKGEGGIIKTVKIRHLSDDELMKLSEEALFLNLEEMKIIQNYFKKINRDPTDAELETLAQTWSEHCVHKTFKAKLIVNGQEKKPLFTRLRESTDQINHPMVLSAFKDNSGVLDFNDDFAVCGKVETHNSPSAIEPYGGASTGSGGVFRDIVGTGKGAKVIASTDIFCLANPDLDEKKLPLGCLHPRYILKRLVQGVRDYGNRMGIPTNNGSLHFHDNFRAKPTVIVGSYGLIKKENIEKETPKPGDFVVTIGGRTGRDGIHGATFSSGSMNEKTQQIHSQAVQIGNAITEKRAFDAVLEMVDHNCIRSITDCGAGGFSSAVGEMAQNVGAKIDLELAPLKYTGLNPWEIWISESQERMILAVPQSKIDEVMTIAKTLNVEATTIGIFTGDNKLQVNYKGKSVIDLDMDFLHNGLPIRLMQAKWEDPEIISQEIPEPENLGELAFKIMADLNIASKEPIYRQYDHNVQGTSVLTSYSGKNFKSPNDGAVMEPILGCGRGMAISHGLNPVLNMVDPYFGSLWALLEAISNLISLGADPEKTVLIDNFIWPFPDEIALGKLDRSVDACVEVANAFQMPFVSGKDSLSSTYKMRDGSKLEIPPTLCISAMGIVNDIKDCVSSTFKKAGNKIIIVGLGTDEMGKSAYFNSQNLEDNNIPKIDLEKSKNVIFSVAHVLKKKLIRSCHDISEGGPFVALAEMCFGENLGAKVDLEKIPTKGKKRADFLAFNEIPGRFILEVEEDKLDEIGEIFKDIDWSVIGEVASSPELTLDFAGYTILNKGVNELRQSWEAPLLRIFGNF